MAWQSSLVSHAGNPAEELLALADLHEGLGSLVIHLGQLDSLAETIQNDLNLVGPHLEAGSGLLAVETGRVLVLVLIVGMI